MAAKNPDTDHRQTLKDIYRPNHYALDDRFVLRDGQVSSAYPPTYIWCGDADSTVSPENTRRMAAALENAGVPVCCEIFPGVEHGVGPGTGTAAGGWIDHALDFWGK